MSSQDKHLQTYVDLYSSLRWNSLVCHSQFLNLFFPDKAASLASQILDELVEELKVRPCPVVFASFSGGPKACMYKVLQILEGKSEKYLDTDKYRLVKDCVSGHIYDSTPVDFTSDLGTRFVLHPTVLKMSRPPLVVSWLANGISSSLDALFITRFELQRAEYWQTLYASVGMGSPYLILCSEDDDLAPCKVICNFAQRLQELGGDVKLVKWSSSPHVGHYRHYPIEYKAAASELLRKAALVYSRRIQQLEGEKMGMESPLGDNSEVQTLQNTRQARTRPLYLNDHFAPDDVEYDVGPAHDSGKEQFICPSKPPSMNLNGVLGQFLFDVCVPKDVENWDIKSRAFSSRSRPHFNPMKCIRRSRL
jgi:farnesol dehydrogenase